MKSVKFDHIVAKLTHQYAPFTTLSRARCEEAVNNLRIMELLEGDQLYLAGRSSDHFLLVVEGVVSVLDPHGVDTIVRTPDEPQYPMVMTADTEGVSLTAHQDSILCYVERQLLDDMVSWEEVTQVIEQTNPDLRHALDHVRNCRVFRRLPFEAVEAAFKRMKHVEVTAGSSIISQGDEADAYYILEEGEANVYFKEDFEEEPELIAQLKSGDAFGSEALISGRTRNESVRMTTDGMLMVLSKQDFEELIRKSFVRTVNNQVANAMLESGYSLLDVRSQEEFDESHIPGTQLIPLGELRARVDELDPVQKYIAYCHSGNRSAMAALVLAEYQIEVYSMDGGIHDWPFKKHSYFLKTAQAN